MRKLRPGSRVLCEDGRAGVVHIVRPGTALVYCSPLRISRWLDPATLTLSTQHNEHEKELQQCQSQSQ
jgi:hypothetical protein